MIDVEKLKPWEHFDGPLPDYDDPLRCVYESGIQYAVNLLANVLSVKDYEVCDGTEEFDGDLGGTMFNIVLGAMPVNSDGDAMHPDEVREAILALAEREKRKDDEIARLKLELEVKDCLADGQYKAGVKAGWNLCADGDETGLHRITGDTSHIAELNRLRALGKEKS